MRQSISVGLAALAALAASAVPAMACGISACGAQTYYGPPVAYAPIAYSPCYTGCNSGWAFEHLAEPDTQYYYVNQGPTYTGPGNWAPHRVYREGSISGYGYGYSRQYRVHRYYHRHHAARYYHGQRVLRRYY